MLIQIAFAIGRISQYGLIADYRAKILCLGRVWSVSGICLEGVWVNLNNVLGVWKSYEMKNINICDNVQLHCFLPVIPKGPNITKK